MPDITPVLCVPMERTGTPDDEITYAFFDIFRQGWPFIRLPYQSNETARTRAALWLLEHEQFSHLIMLDIDHRHPPDVVTRLCRRVQEDPTRLVVGGLNFRRSEPHDPCVFFVEDDGRYYQPAQLPGELFEVSILGFGAVIIAREVFGRIDYPWFYRDLGTREQTRNAGPDVSFSLKCKAAGIKLWCDPFIQSPHLAERWITALDYVEYVKQHTVTEKEHDGVLEIELS